MLRLLTRCAASITARSSNNIFSCYLMQPIQPAISRETNVDVGTGLNPSIPRWVNGVKTRLALGHSDFETRTNSTLPNLRDSSENKVQGLR